MKYPPTLTFLGALWLFTSCREKEPPAPFTPQGVNYTTPGARWDAANFTPWMSRAELQHFQNTSPSDQYFTHVEGRNNSGRLEYRAVIMPFTGEEYVQWAVFWGIGEEELFKCEMNLLSSGFVRQDTQIFASETGKAIHQIVWLKPKPRLEEENRNAVVQNPVASAFPEPMHAPVPAVIQRAADETSVKTPVEETSVAPRVIEEPAKGDVGRVEPKAANPQIPKSVVHVVQQGDTLGKIAKSRKVSVTELKALNHLKSDTLRIGQKLTISAKAK